MRKRAMTMKTKLTIAGTGDRGYGYRIYPDSGRAGGTGLPGGGLGLPSSVFLCAGQNPETRGGGFRRKAPGPEGEAHD